MYIYICGRDLSDYMHGFVKTFGGLQCASLSITSKCWLGHRLDSILHTTESKHKFQIVPSLLDGAERKQE